MFTCGTVYVMLQVVSMCDKMVGTGNSYMESSRCFSVSLKELSSHFEETEVVKVR